MAHAPKDGRLRLRVTKEHRDLIERAAALEGLTLAGFAARHLVDAASRVLERHRVTRLDGERAEAFLRALDGQEPPPGAGRLSRHRGRTALPARDEP